MNAVPEKLTGSFVPFPISLSPFVSFFSSDPLPSIVSVHNRNKGHRNGLRLYKYGASEVIGYHWP